MDFDLNECDTCWLEDEEEECHNNKYAAVVAEQSASSKLRSSMEIMMKRSCQILSSELTDKTMGTSSTSSLESSSENHEVPEHDVFPEEIHKYNLEQYRKQQRKENLRFGFDLEVTTYHTDPVAFLLNEECEDTWHDRQTIRSFDEQYRADVEDLLEQPEQPNSNGKLLSYLWKPQKSSASQQQQQQQRRAIIQAAVLEESFKTCCRAKNEHAMAKAADLIHKEALQSLYACPQEEILGLEQELLAELRGSSASLVVAILDQVDLTVEEQQRSQEEFPMNGHELIAQISLYTSRPSRILAHELALALHASMAPAAAAAAQQQQLLLQPTVVEALPIRVPAASQRGSIFGTAGR